MKTVDSGAPSGEHLMASVGLAGDDAFPKPFLPRNVGIPLAAEKPAALRMVIRGFEPSFAAIRLRFASSSDLTSRRLTGRSHQSGFVRGAR